MTLCFDCHKQVGRIMIWVQCMQLKIALFRENESCYNRPVQSANEGCSANSLPPPSKALVSTQIESNPFHPPWGGSETSWRVSGEGSIGSLGQQPTAKNPLPEASFLGFDPPQGG